MVAAAAASGPQAASLAALEDSLAAAAVSQEAQASTLAAMVVVPSAVDLASDMQTQKSRLTKSQRTETDMNGQMATKMMRKLHMPEAQRHGTTWRNVMRPGLCWWEKCASMAYGLWQRLSSSHQRSWQLEPLWDSLYTSA